MKTARQVAVEALCHMEKEDAWSAPVLASALEGAKLSAEDRGFATALFYGTLTRQYTLDACLKERSNRPLERLDRSVRSILRTAIYQLLYMDVPDHAAVDQAVDLTRAMQKSSAAGFVNGVLRGFLRDNKALPTLKNPHLSEQWALDYSCPPNLVNLWLTHYGEESTQFILEQSLLAPPTFVRTNTTLVNDQDLIEMLEESEMTARPVPGVPHALTVEGSGALHQLEAYEEGFFHIQDISSQRVALTVSPQPGQQVLDTCAAPGGKAFILAQQMENQGRVVATDLYAHRVREINARNQSLTLKNMETHTLDMTQPHPQLGTFDRVLCDVPCSGLGTIRRNPEIKYQLLDSFSTLPSLQYDLLAQGATYCKTGGILVYSTCTLSPAENQRVVARFLKEHPQFQPVLPANSCFEQPEHTVLLGEMGGDGFFLSCMKKIDL